MTPPGQTLNDALLRLAVEGKRPRCGDWNDGNPWLSEDVELRELAAGWCAGCSIFAECGEAATEMKITFGTWAGKDRTKRRRNDNSEKEQ